MRSMNDDLLLQPTDHDWSVIDKYLKVRKKIEDKKGFHRVYWQPLKAKGQIPVSREGTTMVTYKNCLLTFGGLGACSFNDVDPSFFIGNCHFVLGILVVPDFFYFYF